ncbi:hypothetical protein DFH11DRAFT_1612806 [Phellopilus nigrolimitatus]|nr:hypothetical protein DFH11DRAFT_1612806 [Phellopilus nigrolimitatus]
MNYAQKRKRREESPPARSPVLQPHWLSQHESEAGNSNRPAAMLIVEAHEADLVRGQEATALMLEAPSSSSSVDSWAPVKGEKGSGLIKWNSGAEGGGGDVWVDRYDARLLLSALPSLPVQAPEEAGSSQIISTHRSPSPSGWSDLPSDSEDAFFLSATEIADLRREKRRRLLDDARGARLRALEAAADGDGDERDTWGGSDEEPDTAQLALMTLTAARILANHGADGRFAFLRGRWHRAWTGAEREAKVAAEKQEREKAAVGLTGLIGYGDSDSDDDDDDFEGEADGKVDVPAPSAPIAASEDEAAKMEARRARAREWAARKRTENKNAEQSS